MFGFICGLIVGAFFGAHFVYWTLKEDVLKGQVCFGNRAFKCKEILQDEGW